MNKPLTQKNNRASLRWAVTTPALSTVSENNPSESRVCWRSTHASSTLRLPVPRCTEEFVLGTPSAMSVMQIMASNLPASLLSGCSWGCSAAHGPHGWEFIWVGPHAAAPRRGASDALPIRMGRMQEEKLPPAKRSLGQHYSTDAAENNPSRVCPT